MTRKFVLGATALLASYAKGAQPGAATPVAAPMRDLEWGQINFLHTTDAHGWHAGHLLEYVRLGLCLVSWAPF
jgi:2',3'-cyclic-nucleotide 2'-phosphodiesterase (5'-nucleotidase family)